MKRNESQILYVRNYIVAIFSCHCLWSSHSTQKCRQLRRMGERRRYAFCQPDTLRHNELKKIYQNSWIGWYARCAVHAALTRLQLNKRQRIIGLHSTSISKKIRIIVVDVPLMIIYLPLQQRPFILYTPHIRHI